MFVTFNLSVPILIILCKRKPELDATSIVVSDVVDIFVVIVVKDADTEGAAPPYPLSTYNSPANPSGSNEPVSYTIELSDEYLFEPETYRYSKLNPVLLTDLIFNISPSLNPETLATENVTALAAYEEDPAIIVPVSDRKGSIVVELAIIN